MRRRACFLSWASCCMATLARPPAATLPDVLTMTANDCTTFRPRDQATSAMPAANMHVVELVGVGVARELRRLLR